MSSELVIISSIFLHICMEYWSGGILGGWPYIYIYLYIYVDVRSAPGSHQNYGISLKGNSAMQSFKLQPKTNRSFQQNGSRPIEFVWSSICMTYLSKDMYQGGMLWSMLWKHAVEPKIASSIARFERSRKKWATDRKTQDESQWIRQRILSALTIPGFK